MVDERAPGVGAEHSDLEKGEKIEAELRADPSAVILHEVILMQGEEELDRPNRSIMFSGLAAGFTISLSMVGEGVLRASLPEAEWRDLVTGFGYALGFVLVTLGKQQLYTETTLTATLPALRNWKRLPGLLRFWVVVLVANLAGTLLFAMAATAPGLFDEEVRDAFRIMGEEAVDQEFGAVVVKGIVAGWIVALMVWVMPAMGSARILLIVGAAWLIAVAHLTHVIVGSAEVAFAALDGSVTWRDYGLGYVLPALIGNSIGGVIFVALLNHAQVQHEK